MTKSTTGVPSRQAPDPQQVSPDIHEVMHLITVMERRAADTRPAPSRAERTRS